MQKLVTLFLSDDDDDVVSTGARVAAMRVVR